MKLVMVLMEIEKEKGRILMEWRDGEGEEVAGD